MLDTRLMLKSQIRPCNPNDLAQCWQLSVKIVRNKVVQKTTYLLFESTDWNSATIILLYVKFFKSKWVKNELSICSFSHTCYKPLGSTKLYFWKIPSKIFLRIDLQRCLCGEVVWYLPRRGSVADRLTSYSKNIIIFHKNIIIFHKNITIFRKNIIIFHKNIIIFHKNMIYVQCSSSVD